MVETDRIFDCISSHTLNTTLAFQVTSIDFVLVNRIAKRDLRESRWSEVGGSWYRSRYIDSDGNNDGSEVCRLAVMHLGICKLSFHAVQGYVQISC